MPDGGYSHVSHPPVENTSMGSPSRAAIEAAIVKLIRFACAVMVVGAISWTTVDPDLWGHLLSGRDVLVEGGLPEHDAYSFTSDREIIDHEWLGQVLLFVAYDIGGSVGLVALKTSVVVAAAGLMFVALRRSSLKSTQQDALILLALVTMLPRFHPARPQVFSLFLFALLLHVLTAVDRGERKKLVALPLLTAAWANLHGGFLVGLAVLGVWTTVRLYQETDALRRFALIGAAVAAVVATVLNPYGIGLWRFLWSTVGLQRPGINDWQPLYALGLVTIIPFVIFATTVMIAVAFARRRVDWLWAVIVGILGIAAVRVSRIDAFFAIAAVMLLGPSLGATVHQSPPSPHHGPLPGRLRLSFALIASVVLVTGLSIVTKGATCIEILSGPEAESIEFFEQNGLRGRVLTFFDWGLHTAWHLAPDVQVSIDGRRETVYSDELFAAHVRLYRNETNAVSLVEKLNPDFIWLPAGMGVIETLQKAGWNQIFAGPKSTILSRERRSPTILRTAAIRSRCFPDR
jgi:hypothetical protein